jgi:hypothetical protein
MKHILFIIMALTFAVSAQATDVGVSISVGQPGFYGQIDIGNFPRPQVIYPQPVVISPVPVGVTQAPLYLHVPPGHEKHWKKHCHKYNACGRPVYFVRNQWYDDVYVPEYQARHGHGGGHGDEHGGGHHDNGKHGGGHDKGHGKGKGGD